jgi:hypothetical protein
VATGRDELLRQARELIEESRRLVASEYERLKKQIEEIDQERRKEPSDGNTEAARN